MTPEAAKWRDHFEDCERDQLQRFPLCQHPLRELETPLLRAQYQIALSHFQKSFSLDVLRVIKQRLKRSSTISRLESYRKATAFRADRATREAFYEHFAQEPIEDYFCMRAEEWEDVFAIETQEWGWEDRYSTSWHTFTAIPELKPQQLRFSIGAPLPKSIPPESLFLREQGTLVHHLGGDGSADLWHWNGEELIHLHKYDSIWMA